MGCDMRESPREGRMSPNRRRRGAGLRAHHPQWFGGAKRAGRASTGRRVMMRQSTTVAAARLTSVGGPTVHP